MSANDSPALRARPFCFFTYQKIPYSIFSDVLKIFNDAQMIFIPISDIHPLQNLAGKIFALKAKARLPALKNCAVLDLAANTGDGFVSCPHPAAGTLVFLPKMRPTDATIDAAWRNEHADIRRFHNVYQ
jgi:hypothetical protein